MLYSKIIIYIPIIFKRVYTAESESEDEEKDVTAQERREKGPRTTKKVVRE